MPGGTGGPSDAALAAWAALDEETCMRVQTMLAGTTAAAQPSLWDVPPKPRAVRTMALPAGKRPERHARVMVDGDMPARGQDITYAYMGAMVCGREREYALLVKWDERDEAMAPRRCVSIERVRVVVSE